MGFKVTSSVPPGLVKMCDLPDRAMVVVEDKHSLLNSERVVVYGSVAFSLDSDCRCSERRRSSTRCRPVPPGTQWVLEAE